MRPTCLVCVIALCAAPSAGASIAVALSVETLGQRAELVAVGRVVGQSTHWSRDHRRLYTRTRVQLEERWVERGAKVEGTVTLSQAGGELDGLGQQISGEPRFQAGERVLLFLERRGDFYRTVGMAQGVFRVVAGQAQQDLSGLALARRGTDGRLAIGEHGVGGEAPQSLAALKLRVLALKRPSP